MYSVGNCMVSSCNIKCNIEQNKMQLRKTRFIIRRALNSGYKNQ